MEIKRKLFDSLKGLSKNPNYNPVNTLKFMALRKVVHLSQRPFPLLRKMSTSTGPVSGSIHRKLMEAIRTEHIEVINESSSHNVPKGSETHFKVVIVSPDFEGLSLIARHRKVNTVLEEELRTGVHALSIKAKTPEQWSKSNHVEPSPNCRGGNGL